MSVIILEDVIDSLQNVKGISPEYRSQCEEWWRKKSLIWPEQIVSKNGHRTDSTRLEKVCEELPITCSFEFSDFRKWYSEFILEVVQQRPTKYITGEGIPVSRELVRALKEVAHDDPTIYPITEKRIDMQTRTTWLGGVLSFVDAELPARRKVRLAAKKVPDRDLFNQERKNHQWLRGAGYESVTECISFGTQNQVLTYGRLAGDLRQLKDQPAEVKREYILMALKELMKISVDIKDHLESDKMVPAGGTFYKPPTLKGKNLDKLCDVARNNNEDVDVLVERFVENYILRVAMSAGGVYLPKEGSELKLCADIILGKRPDDEISSTFQETHPHLAGVVSNYGQNSRIVQVYSGLARRIDGLDKFPGHDDFTVNNVLAKRIEESRDGKVIFQNLQLHDVGLVNAPFQNYIFDMAVSAGADLQLQEEIVRDIFYELKNACDRSGVELRQSLEQFEEGYSLVSAAKSLTEASIRYMKQMC